MRCELTRPEPDLVRVCGMGFQSFTALLESCDALAARCLGTDFDSSSQHAQLLAGADGNEFVAQTAICADAGTVYLAARRQVEPRASAVAGLTDSVLNYRLHSANKKGKRCQKTDSVDGKVSHCEEGINSMSSNILSLGPDHAGACGKDF